MVSRLALPISLPQEEAQNWLLFSNFLLGEKDREIERERERERDEMNAQRLWWNVEHKNHINSCVKKKPTMISSQNPATLEMKWRRKRIIFLTCWSCIDETHMTPTTKRFEVFSTDQSQPCFHTWMTVAASSSLFSPVKRWPWCAERKGRDTVLSGAEERFAEERPGWNFRYKNKNDPGWKIELRTVSLHGNNVCCEDDFFSGIADFETTPRRRVETFQPLPRPSMCCVRVKHRYRVVYRVGATSLAMWLEDESKIRTRLAEVVKNKNDPG